VLKFRRTYWKCYILAIFPSYSFALPDGFVYLKHIAPNIKQDIRYAQSYNFIGRPISGYKQGVCILTKKAAKQLAKVELAAEKIGYRLKVYDCYRPVKAVRTFYRWSQRNNDKKMKAAFYPREEKSQLFGNGYIARRSGHSRGSTVDITLVKTKSTYKPQSRKQLDRCYDKTRAYLNDNSIDMGTRFDCLDISAHYHYSGLSKTQKHNRYILRQLMTKYGFKPYSKEWWHFTLNKEPYPKTYFNFNVR